MVEKVSVMEEEWDYLIILDACRYDFFSKLYPPYLSGELKKIVSPGSSTIEWCKKSFQKKYNDVIYISANPFINSKVEVLNFNSKNHFYKVIDVWDWGWNENLGTVHPKTVNEVVQSFKDDYPDKRFIIHYLQPHEPYLGNSNSLGFSKPRPRSWALLPVFRTFGIDVTRLDSRLLKILNCITKTIEPRLNGQNLLRKFRKLLNLEDGSPIDAMQRKVGNEGLRRAYAENLRFVLDYVARLVEKISGVIVVTSDHGERLGEGNNYSHYSGVYDPLLMQVPWFKVEKAVK